VCVTSLRCDAAKVDEGVRHWSEVTFAVSRPSGFAAVILVDHPTGKALPATVWNGGGEGQSLA
jgi:hypothetical protein